MAKVSGVPGSGVTGPGGGLDNGGATAAGRGLGELCGGKLTANNFNASWAEIEEKQIIINILYIHIYTYTYVN